MIISSDKKEPHSSNGKPKDSRKQSDGYKEHFIKVPQKISKFLKNKRRPKSVITLTENDSSFSLRCAVRDFDSNRVIKIVANQHVDIDGAGQNGVTALHEAAIDGNINSLKILVDHGADINKGDSEGYTPLDYAVFGGNFECAAYLIENGAKEDRIKDGQISYHEGVNKNRSFTFA